MDFSEFFENHPNMQVNIAKKHCTLTLFVHFVVVFLNALMTSSGMVIYEDEWVHDSEEAWARPVHDGPALPAPGPAGPRPGHCPGHQARLQVPRGPGQAWPWGGIPTMMHPPYTNHSMGHTPPAGSLSSQTTARTTTRSGTESPGALRRRWGQAHG